MSELLARVRPLVGEALHECRVAIAGSADALPLVAYLVACGVRQWIVVNGEAWAHTLVEMARVRYGDEFDINVKTVASWAEVGAPDLAIIVDDAEAARRMAVRVARLAIATPTEGAPCCAVIALPGETFDQGPQRAAGPTDEWAWCTSAPLMGLLARALLLRHTEYALTAWQGAWERGLRIYHVGSASDPTLAWWQTHLDGAGMSQPTYRTPPVRRGTLLVAGVGSLGSVAGQQLAPWVERLVLVDPDCVELTNLVRQAYSYEQIGAAKAVALAQTIHAAHPHVLCDAGVDRLHDEEQVARLINRYGITAALVTTGTHADFAIGRALRDRGIPHVVGRCYGRARFWEGIVVDGERGPSYEEMRRGVAAGPTPAPTPEEVAAYGAVGELVAEPATAMETGWAAMWLARLTQQMMMPRTLREGWLLARLAAGANCFIGGVVVEKGEGENGAAYGVDVAGKIHAWSVAEIG